MVVLITRWSCSSMPLNSCLMVSFSFPGWNVTSTCRVNSPPAEDGEDELNVYALPWLNSGALPSLARLK